MVQEPSLINQISVQITAIGQGVCKRIEQNDQQVIHDLVFRAAQLLALVGCLPPGRLMDAARHFNETVLAMSRRTGEAEWGDVLRKAWQSLQTTGHAELRALVKVLPAQTGDAPQGMPILVVEDDRSVSSYLQNQLAQFNYEVEVIAALDQLQSALEKRPYFALICDVNFAEGDTAGPEALVALRKRGVVVPPVLFASAYSGFASRLAAVRAEGRAYMLKPLDISELVQALNQLMPNYVAERMSVLIIDDQRSSAEYHAQILAEAGMQVLCVTNPARALNALAEFPAELILMDWYMPECSGVELVEILRQQGQYDGIPIAFLSGEKNREQQIFAMQHGGDDFIDKPVHPEHLVALVRLRIERYRSLRQRIEHDGLTGLYHHTAMENYLEQEIARARRENTPLSFAMLDLDHFKQVNDVHGHAAGDQVLRSLAHMLKQRLRKTDIIGRYGGEEFVVILPNTTPSAAEYFLNTVREVFALISHRSRQGEFSVTLSAGVAEWRPGQARSVCDMADEALYEAKKAGRNRVVRAKQ